MLLGAVAAVSLVQPLGWEATVLIVCAVGATLLFVTAVSEGGDRSLTFRRCEEPGRHAKTCSDAENSCKLSPSTANGATERHRILWKPVRAPMLGLGAGGIHGGGNDSRHWLGLIPVR